MIFKELESSRRDAAIIEYHRELSALGVPLILFYLYEEAGGLAYSKEVLRELLGMPSVVGMKMAALDSVMTLQEVSSLFSSEFPGKLLITGEDRMFGYSLMCGATGALVGLGAAFPNIQSDLITAYRSKDYPYLWICHPEWTLMRCRRLRSRWTNIFCGCCGVSHCKGLSPGRLPMI